MGKPAVTTTTDLDFTDPALASALCDASDAELDQLCFGVIGFDADGVVRRYNAWESRAAGLSPERVIGQPLFTTVAPCMNNFLVAQRFEDAAASSAPLDATIPYVLTLRMRPTKVQLRLLASPGGALRHVVIQRP